MRRMIHNTTAIVTCLSLVVPSFAIAQTPTAEEVKKLEQQLAQEAEETVPAEAAPAAEAPVEEPAATEAAPAAEAPVEEPAATEAAPAAEAPAEEPAATEVAPAAEAPAEEPAATEAAPAAEAPAEEPAATEAAPAAESPVEEPAATGAAPAAEAPAEEPAATEAVPAAEAPEKEPAATEVAPAAEAPAEEPAATEAAPAAEAPAEEPAATEAAPAAEAPAEDAATEATPATEAPAEEPAATEAAPAAEEEPAATEATSDSTAPVQTEAAKEAASASAPETGSIAALDESASGEVVDTKVTEEDARTSDEDFTTSLTEALTASQNQQPAQEAAKDDDDDKKDLAKALLLGLGGVAVGAMLTNNRQVSLSTPDRVVVTRQDGSQEIIKDEVALLRQPGSTVSTENFDDGSSRTIVTREDGSKVVTIRDADLRVLRRTLVSADGQSTQLIDDTQTVDPVDVASLPAAAPIEATGIQDEAALREALQREANINRSFTLGQIRNIPEVRALVAPVNIDAITFDTGSAAITSDQAQQLATLGNVIQETIAANPQEIFLIEGHTDAVGSAAANLALSDRRAESVALALSEYFDVPPENMVVQGYGEQYPKVRADGESRENRRAAVRRITQLLQTSN